MKCSLKKHQNIDAISCCQDCQKYFCNKCQNLHSDLFDNHTLFNLKDSNEIFTNIYPEKDHCKLEFFCKNHNTLCCLACISRIKKKFYGQHNICEICLIEEIKDVKKNNLKKNIVNVLS